MTPEVDDFAAAAEFYFHRPGYAPKAIQWIVDHLGLDGKGRLLDVGCGTGHVCLRLAGAVSAIVGIDPSRAMLNAAEGIVAARGIPRVVFRQMKAEDLPSDLGSFRVITFGDSFHRTDRERMAEIAHAMLEPGGGLALLFRSTPWRANATWAGELRTVIEEYTGRTVGGPFEPSQNVIRRSTFGSCGESAFRQEHVWTIPELVGFMKSTALCSPRELGSKAADFEHELVERLSRANPDALFRQVLETTVVIAIKT